jgi:hypothetical protein
MSWRFRQSFSIIPGLRLNLSKGGLSMSVGGAPFTMNIGPRGVYGTASLPGTGLSYRQRLDGGGSRDGGEPSPPYESTNCLSRRADPDRGQCSG